MFVNHNIILLITSIFLIKSRHFATVGASRVAALAMLRKTNKPDWLVVQPSGSLKPQPQAALVP